MPESPIFIKYRVNLPGKQSTEQYIYTQPILNKKPAAASGRTGIGFGMEELW
jgi:hypothetical protein